jgi:membrane fusion protein (multidrug efflux system)
MSKQSSEAPAQPAVTPLRPKLADASSPAPSRTSAGQTRPRRSRRQLIRWTLITVGPLLVLLVAAWYVLTSGRYVSTDDAFVKTDLASISAQVPGQVIAVHVRNNQGVKAGDPLFEIDPASYQIALSQAEADLANVVSQIAAMRANYFEKAAQLKNAEEMIQFQQREFSRQSNLRASGVASEQKLDEARRALENAQRQAEMIRQQMAATAAQLGGDVNTPTEQIPSYRAALARRNDAALALARTKVVAPADGVLANVTLRPGDYVTAGAPVFSLAEIAHTWIEANFKETDLTHVVDGQPATVTVDTYPGLTWAANVESLSPASGNEFSLLPAQNSSGNWVKVVQRIPVRLRVQQPENAPTLRAGMSVDVEIDTGPHHPHWLTKLTQLF